MYKLKEKKLFGFVPLFFPRALQSYWSRTHVEPTFYDEFGVKVPICSSYDTHKWVFTRVDKRLRCYWCRKYKDELYGDKPLNEASLGFDGSTDSTDLNVPKPDFNFDTTPTVNPIDLNKVVPDDPDVLRKKEYGDISTMHAHGVTAYCMRCKIKQTVLDPEYFVKETKRGIKTYLKGSCAVCGSKITALVKVGK